MRQQLDEFLQRIGYQVIPSNLPEFTIYYQLEYNYVNVIHIVEDRQGLSLKQEQLEHIKEKISELFLQKGYKDSHILSIILSDDVDKVREITINDTFCWILLPVDRRLVIYENHAADFYGLKEKLEDWLVQAGQDDYTVSGKKKIKEKVSYSYLKEKSYITILITFINAIIFLICTFTGDLLYNIGELNVIRVFQDGEYYRIFTCMFLHGDINHLFSNMIIFFFLGEIVEESIGHIKYLFLYFTAGIGGGLLSMGYSFYLGTFINSIGASGAIFGVTGALLWLVIVHKGRLESITLGKILFLIVYSLYSGFTSTNVDNAAHIGGLITGLLFTIVFYRNRKAHYCTDKEYVE